LEFGVKFDVTTLTFLNTASTLDAQAADGWVEDITILRPSEQEHCTPAGRGELGKTPPDCSITNCKSTHYSQNGMWKV